MRVFIRKHMMPRLAAVSLPAFGAAAFAVAGGQGFTSYGAGDPPGRVARLSALSGAVSFLAPGSPSWAQPAINYTITSGDRLYAPPGARAELDVGESAVRLGDGADVTVTNLTDNFAQFGLTRGTTRTSIYRWIPSDSIELDTPNGALLPRAVGRYNVSIDPQRGFTTVNVETGRLEVFGPGLHRVIRDGETVQLSGTNPVQMSVLSYSAGDDFERWALMRDRRFETAAPALRYVGNGIPGWEDLDSYGTWYTDVAYGPVWYPSSVGADWVPYRDGHWAWVEPWGWTWVDDEPWGFAPTHYGRWARLARGWGWMPGPVVQQPVYSPALVAFVDGSSFREPRRAPVQGWFPLGPREPFIPWYRHSDVYLRQVNATNLRDVDVDRVVRVQDVDRFAWRNRAQATTVVREETFRNGLSVARDVIRLRPEQMATARLASHMSIAPAPRLAVGGTPANRPPMAATRPVFARPGGAESRERSAGGEVVMPPPAPPRAMPAQPVAPRGVPTQPFPPRAIPAQPTVPNAQPPRPVPEPRPVITRNPPPPVAPPAAKEREVVRPRPEPPMHMPSLPPGLPQPAALPPQVPRPQPRAERSMPEAARTAPEVAHPAPHVHPTAPAAYPAPPAAHPAPPAPPAGHPAPPALPAAHPAPPAAHPAPPQKQPRPPPGKPDKPEKKPERGGGGSGVESR